MPNRTEFATTEDLELLNKSRSYGTKEALAQVARSGLEAFLSYQSLPEGFAQRAASGSLTMEDASRLFDEAMLAGVTRQEAYQMARAGLKLTHIAPKSELIQRVKGVNRAISKHTDEALAPISYIDWQQKLAGGRKLADQPFGVARGADFSVGLNPTKGTAESLERTFTHEARHVAGHFDDPELFKLYDKGREWLKKKAKLSDFDLEVHDPFEVDARFFARQLTRGTPVGSHSTLMEDVYGISGIKKSAESFEALAKRFLSEGSEQLGKDAEKIAIGFRALADRKMGIKTGNPGATSQLYLSE
jgi:hypothetical protein